MSKILNKKDIINFLKKTTILELNELIKDIEKEFNVKSFSNINMNNSDNKNKNEKKKEEKKNVSVTLIKITESKIGVIKVLRDITGLTMMESKSIIDNMPKIFKENISMKEAEKIKKKLIKVGGIVEIK